MMRLDFISRARHTIRWRLNLSEEIDYWRDWIESKGDELPENFYARIDPTTEIKTNLQQCLVNLPGNLRILDVGAGPVTGIGYVLPGRTVDVTAIDALADSYNELLDRYKVTVPIRTIPGKAERLTKYFPEGAFDLVHCRNALDHCYAPLEAIKQMVAVVRAEGKVVLDHHANEADTLGYVGLHQWNFDIQNKRFILWDRRRQVDIADAFKGVVNIEFRQYAQGRPWIEAVLTKK